MASSNRRDSLAVCVQFKAWAFCESVTRQHSEGRMGGIFEAALNIDAATPLPLSKLSKSPGHSGQEKEHAS